MDSQFKNGSGNSICFSTISIDSTNDRIDRWASGDLDTSQGREDEPFGLMLGSQIVFGFSRIDIRSLS